MTGTLSGLAISATLIAVLVFIRSAEAGHPCDAGVSYYSSRSERVAACKTAAEHGDPEAQLKYALMLASGRYAEQDMDGAIQWLRASARNGRPDAQLLLAGVLSERRSKNSRDLIEAYAWFSVAGAERDMARLAERMDDAQRAEAEQLAAETREKYGTPPEDSEEAPWRP